MFRCELTESSVFFLSVLHSGDSGVSLLGEEIVVAFLFSAITASPIGRDGSLQRCLMSCEAEHLASTVQHRRHSDREGYVSVLTQK